MGGWGIFVEDILKMRRWWTVGWRLWVEDILKTSHCCWTGGGRPSVANTAKTRGW